MDGILRLADGREVLAARVRAAPENGLANKALEQLVARWLGLSRAKVAVVSGHTARLKTLKIEAEAEMLSEALATLPQG